MHNGTPPRFLFMRGLKNFFLFSGSGIQDEQNGLHVLACCEVGPKRKSTKQNQEHKMN
jgi:hypothetical protein